MKGDSTSGNSLCHFQSKCLLVKLLWCPIDFMTQLPEIYIRSLAHSCCFRPWSLMPLLHSGPFERLILDVHPFRVLNATLAWLYLLQSSLLCRATFARCMICMCAMASSFRDSQLAWIRIFPMNFLFLPCHFCMAGHFPVYVYISDN
jgi:hypothetical protein